VLRLLVAFPESRRILWIHLIASPFLALQWGAMAMVPVLLRGHFGASPWQTTAATAAIPLMFILSIVWGELYRRLDGGRYIVLVWLLAAGPLGLMAICRSPSALLACMFLSAVGLAGMNPLNGDILRSCYPPNARSKIYALTQMVAQSTIMVITYGIGIWLDRNEEAFRIYMPAAAAGVAVGMLLIHAITRQRLFQERLRHNNTLPLVASLRGLARLTTEAFRKDRDFLRLEIAFLVYGLGWMICQAILPFLVWDVLRLSYADVARATQSTFQLTLVLTMLPVSYLMDRYGPVRMAAWGFLMVAIYPLGLILVVRGTTWMDTVTALTLVTVWFGVGVSAIHLAWTIGPVSLAPTASDASHYLATHASMVAPRTLVGQALALGLYTATGSVHLPLAAAVACAGTGAVLMFRLHAHRRRPPRPIVPEQIIPTPPKAT